MRLGMTRKRLVATVSTSSSQPALVAAVDADQGAQHGGHRARDEADLERRAQPGDQHRDHVDAPCDRCPANARTRAAM